MKSEHRTVEESSPINLTYCNNETKDGSTGLYMSLAESELLCTQFSFHINS